MRQGLKLVVGLVLPLVVLVGCSQAEAEAEPVITYPSETVEEPSEATSEEWTVPSKEELYPYPKPEMPAIAQEHTQAGAEAFSKYFIEIYTYAVATRDIDALEELCTERSGFCSHNAGLMESLLGTGSFLLDYRVYDLEITGSLEGGSNEYVEWGTQLIGYVSPHTLQFGDGTEPREFEEYHFVAGVEVSWDDGWKVEEAQVVDYEDVYDD
ncbi:MAG: DUF6318 family protein [Gleimia sp.]